MVTEKRRRGRAVPVLPADRQRIAMLAAAGNTKAAIARKTGRARETVAAVLASPESEMIRSACREILQTGLDQVARDFLTAIHEGALKGRHEGALAALLHLGVLEPQAKVDSGGQTVTVQLGVSLPGTPGGHVLVGSGTPPERGM